MVSLILIRWIVIYPVDSAILRNKNPTKTGKNANIRGKKTHVYRVAGMIASIRGKKPHVYRVIILKQTEWPTIFAFFLVFAAF